MSHLGEELARRYRHATDDVLSEIAVMTSERWETIVPGEGWAVGVIAHHLAVSCQFVMALLEQVVQGGDIHWTQEFIDDANAMHAEVFEAPDRAETVELLTTQVDAACRYISSLTQDDLDRRPTTPLDYSGGYVDNSRKIVELMLINHTVSHLESVRSTG
ncbi:MAG TPA: DinB family protein [Actinomycetota bacterium]|nr:DinB family protein [Actinomycetota bacterium]